MSKPLLQAKGIEKSYMMGKIPVHVLRGVDVELQAGEFVAVTGSSGSGKSTLLHILGAVDTPDGGVVHFDGVSVHQRGSGWRNRYRNEQIGFIFQFYHLLPELNVFENILIPQMVRYSTLRWMSVRSQVRREVAEMIERVGLGHRIKHRPNELSGGERQRAAIARALVNKPALLFADEPTGNLDAATGGEILDVLKQLNEQGQTILMVTHDPNVAGQAHRNISLVDGKICQEK